MHQWETLLFLLFSERVSFSGFGIFCLRFPILVSDARPNEALKNLQKRKGKATDNHGP